ncbi:MAG: serine/threonine-protein kinase [Planctomycetota bacterium]
METGTEIDTITKRFEALADQFTNQLRNNESPQVERYVVANPDLEPVIRRLFPVLEMMEAEGSLPESVSSLESVKSTLESFASTSDGKHIGDFRIIREIGRGGMGIVYLAHQKSLDREVALKLVSSSAQFDERRRQRFQQEARASAMLHHTNIVPIFDIGQHEDLSFLVMQFINARSLDDVLAVDNQQRSAQKAGTESTIKMVDQSTNSVDLSEISTDDGVRLRVDAPDFSSSTAPAPHTKRIQVNSTKDEAYAKLLTPADRFRWVARVGIQIADALAHAHEKGILHRDIKPSNLLVNDRGNAWVTDFGLAKSVDSPEITMTGEIVGTLRYMSPEQMNGAPEVRSDIFGLGMTLYEAATGQPAYDARSRERLIQQIINAQPKRIQTVEPRVPRDLATIIEKAIASEPDKRYRDAEAMADDLHRFVRGEPILARRVSVFERGYKWCARRPLIAALMMGMLLCFVAGIAGVAYHIKTTQSAFSDLKKQSKATSDALASLKVQSNETEKALAESKKQSELSLRTLNYVIDDFAKVFDKQSVSKLEAQAKRSMAQRVLQGLEHVSYELKSRNDYGKTLIWTHIDLGHLYLRIGGKGFKNAEHLAAKEFGLAMEKSTQWIKNHPESRSAKEVYSESLDVLGRQKFYKGDFAEAIDLVVKAAQFNEAFVEESKATLDWDRVHRELEDSGISHEQVVSYNDDVMHDDEIDDFKDLVESKSDVTREELRRIRVDTRDRRRLLGQYELIALIHYRGFQLEKATHWYDKTTALIEESRNINPMTIDRGMRVMIDRIEEAKINCLELPAVRKNLDHAMKFEDYAQRLLYNCAAWQAFDGDYEAAAATLGRIDSIEGLSGPDHYNNACGYSRCLKAMMNDRVKDALSTKEAKLCRTYHKKAMSSLESAAASGFFDNATFIGLMGRDHDLDVIRETPEFAAFFESIAEAD